MYRQEQQFVRLGYSLSRQTMANWMIYGAEQWLLPLVDAMKSYLLESGSLHADETTLQVLESGKIGGVAIVPVVVSNRTGCPSGCSLRLPAYTRGRASTEFPRGLQRVFACGWVSRLSQSKRREASRLLGACAPQSIDEAISLRRRRQMGSVRRQAKGWSIATSCLPLNVN